MCWDISRLNSPERLTGMQTIRLHGFRMTGILHPFMPSPFITESRTSVTIMETGE